MSTDFQKADFSGKHSGVTDIIIGAFFEVYNELGGGFLESVYHQAMLLALTQAGVQVECEVPVPVYFRGAVVGNFKADILVENLILLELKATSALDRVHEAQLLHYLRATKIEVGLLLNFGPQAKFKRFILGNAKKHIREHP